MSHANSLSICIAGESREASTADDQEPRVGLLVAQTQERRKCLFGSSFPAHTFAVTGSAFFHLPVFPVLHCFATKIVWIWKILNSVFFTEEKAGWNTTLFSFTKSRIYSKKFPGGI